MYEILTAISYFNHSCLKQALALRLKSRPQALLQLQRKKRLLAILDKRAGSTETIREILDTIQKMETDKEVRVCVCVREREQRKRGQREQREHSILAPPPLQDTYLMKRCGCLACLVFLCGYYD